MMDVRAFLRFMRDWLRREGCCDSEVNRFQRVSVGSWITFDQQNRVGYFAAPKHGVA